MTVTNADGEHTVPKPTTDEAFSLLSNVYRRRLLVVLLSESRVEPERLVPDQSTEVPTRLHHVHLPKLDDADLVDWDAERGFVTQGNRFETVEPMLQLLADNPSATPANWV